MPKKPTIFTRIYDFRSTDPAQVIHVMKSIVTVCRSITEEIEKNENVLSLDKKNSLYDLKTRFSTSLSDLLVAAKYHASGMGLSPVSLLDRSAGHLTSVIIELAKLLGMNTTVAEIPKPKSNISSLLSSLNDEPYKNKSDNFSYYGSSLLNRTLSNNHKSTNGDDMKSSRPGIDSYGYKSNNNSYYGKQNNNQLTPTELVVRYHMREYNPLIVSFFLEISQKRNRSYRRNHPKPTRSTSPPTTKRRSTHHHYNSLENHCNNL